MADNQQRILNPPHNTSNYLSGSNLGISDKATIPIVSPNYVQQYLLPATEELKQKIYSNRDKIFNALHQNIHEQYNQPLLVVTGPSYVGSVEEAEKCGEWLEGLQDLLTLCVNKSCLVCMRVNLKSYNEKYAPINAAHLPSIMTFDIAHGIPECRQLLYTLSDKLPLVGDVCDLITPQFFHDLFSMGLVSSTLAELQLHREMISACSFAVAVQTSDSNLPFDNKFYDGKIALTLDAMYASAQPHQFLNITKEGLVAVVGTTGNSDTFVILEVNSQITVGDLRIYFEQVYAYPKHNNNVPKIMLDVGKLTDAEYEDKLGKVEALFSDKESAKKINGVLIDSGEEYGDQEGDLLVNTKKMVNELAKFSRRRCGL